MRLIPELDYTFRNAACLTCNRPRRDPDRLVDLEAPIEYEGRLAMCESCAEEMFALLGMASKKTVASMEAQMATKDARISDLERRHELMRSFVD